MKFKERIKTYIEAKGMKLAQLIEISRVKPSTFYSAMQSKKKGPSLKILEDILRNSDISARFLLIGEGDPIESNSANDTERFKDKDKLIANLQDYIEHLKGELRRERSCAPAETGASGSDHRREKPGRKKERERSSIASDSDSRG